MSLPVKEDITADPREISLFSPEAVMAEAQKLPHLIEEFRLAVHRSPC
jgi:hypothetical protein